MLFCCVYHLRQWAFVIHRRLAVFPKVDAASPRGLMAPPGLTPLGAKGSVRDRLCLPDSLRACRPRELYSTALCVSRMGYASQPKLASSLPNKRPSFWSADRLGRYGALRRQYKCRLWAAKTFTTGLRPGTTSQPPLRASEKSFPLARFAGLPPQAVAE